MNDKSDSGAGSAAVDHAEIVRLIDQYHAGLSQGAGPFSLEKVAHLYKRDDAFTAYDLSPPNGGYAGWRAYEAAWSEIMSNYNSFHIAANDDLRIGLLGDVAWSSCSFRVWGERKGGQPYLAEGRTSLVWVRQHGGWLITHEHVSTPRHPPQPRQ